jgi:hypothetical protein
LVVYPKVSNLLKAKAFTVGFIDLKDHYDVQLDNYR